MKLKAKFTFNFELKTQRKSKKKRNKNNSSLKKILVWIALEILSILLEKLVTQIIELIMNRPFYFYNRIFYLKERRYFMTNDVSTSLKTKCRLFDFNSRNGIKHFLAIPEDIDMNNLRQEVLKCYKFLYLKKSKLKKESKEQRIEKYLSPNVIADIYDEVPEDYDRDKYRTLINIKKENEWLKKSLKKINKELSKSLINRVRQGNRKIKINYDVDYLHSSMKKRSYETNAKTHKGKKHILAIDIQNFYPSIKEHKVYSFFKKEMGLDIDIATIYTILCTCPLDDPNVKENFEFGIGQGLATSPILAYLINYKMFDYIALKAKENGLKMTVYVDDIVFSSDYPIPQKFIDSLFSIVKQNGMNIKRKKVHLYNEKQTKKITGIFLTSTNNVRVAKSKHEELLYQYNYLSANIFKVTNIKDYFDIYNLFIRFNGNVQFVNLVEGDHSKKYNNFINQYRVFFPIGLKKKKKNEIYKKDNLFEDDYNAVLKYYKKFIINIKL